MPPIKELLLPEREEHLLKTNPALTGLEGLGIHSIGLVAEEVVVEVVEKEEGDHHQVPLEETPMIETVERS